MEPRRVVWREHNLRHITTDHPERRVNREDVEDVLGDLNRHEKSDRRHGTIVASGRNRDGDAFVVAFLELSDGSAFPVHARRGHSR